MTQSIVAPPPDPKYRPTKPAETGGSPQRPPRVLYVASMVPGRTSLQRYHAMTDLGCDVTAIDSTNRTGLPFHERVRRRLRGPRDWTGANQKIRETIAHKTFDALWIDKGLTIDSETLQAVKRAQPGCRIIGFSPDDMYQRHNQSPQFRRHLPLYDWFFTTKTFGVRELRSIGAQRVAFHDNGFDPHTHHPLALTDAERARYGGPVGFVGAWEHARAASIRRLVSAGVPVRVWGTRWAVECVPQPSLLIEASELHGVDYARALSSFDINLCFLRKLNRDRQTTRSVEIPACGAFMLAERTDEHLGLFEEGVEAEFFASDEEMIDKARYYLDHPVERQRIATAGLERCRRGRYSYRERLQDMLTTAGLLEGGTPLNWA